MDWHMITWRNDNADKILHLLKYIQQNIANLLKSYLPLSHKYLQKPTSSSSSVIMGEGRASLPTS